MRGVSGYLPCQVGGDGLLVMHNHLAADFALCVEDSASTAAMSLMIGGRSHVMTLSDVFLQLMSVSGGREIGGSTYGASVDTLGGPQQSIRVCVIFIFL